jgi:hypothetical protein
MAKLSNSFELWLTNEKLPYLTQNNIEFDVVTEGPERSKIIIHNLDGRVLTDIFYSGTQYGMDMMSKSYRQNLKTA